MSREHASADERTGPPTGNGHWHDYARYWNLLGSPLRPGDEDIRLYRDLLVEHLGPALDEGRHVLLYGVTPEFASMDWSGGQEIFAVERVPATIAALWPGNDAGRRAICADWLQLPFADGQFDLAIGDGSLIASGGASAQRRLIAAAWRSVREGGWLCLRLFCLPDRAECVEDVFAALEHGSVGSFHAFKWRLAMALQGDAADVPVAEIWHAWHAAGIDARRLAAERGWQPEAIDTVAVYRDSPLRYRFARLDALLAELDAGGFTHVATRHGHYELAERCPIVLLRRRAPGPAAALKHASQ